MLLNKRYSIRSKKRFISFLIATTLVVGITLYLLVSSTFSRVDLTVEADTMRVLSEEEVSFISRFEQVEIHIKAGDSAWVIQDELTPNYDVRQMLYYGNKINKRNIGNIEAGETITFLKELE